MKLDQQGYVFPPYKLTPDKSLAESFLRGQGAPVDLSKVPPTYFIFLRGRKHDVDMFEFLGISYKKALHGGQRYEWYQPIGWEDELDVTVTIEKITEKEGRGGKIWFADISYDYARPDGSRVLREITHLIERE